MEQLEKKVWYEAKQGVRINGDQVLRFKLVNKSHPRKKDTEQHYDIRVQLDGWAHLMDYGHVAETMLAKWKKA